jgi:hypothetical protein
VWGGGGGGGGGSSFASTDQGATASAASVAITYTPVPTGSPDLKIFLKHRGIFRHGHRGSYQMWVTNTGTAATAKSTTVTLNLPAGITMVHGGKGAGWQCSKEAGWSTCTRAAAIVAKMRTTIIATVKVSAGAGRRLVATATVSPTDKTPNDNTRSDTVIIRS